MKISALSAASGVPVPTIKYYLREALLPPGISLSRTQAAYGQEHVERLRLIRALIDVGGLGIGEVAAVLAVIDGPSAPRLDVLDAAQSALPSVVRSQPAQRPGAEGAMAPGPELEPGAAESARPSEGPAARWLRARGWRIDAPHGLVEDLEAAWSACDATGLGLDAARLDAYADAVEEIARIDIASVPSQKDRAVRQVVLGTVLVDPLLAVLRRLAQQHLSIAEESGRAEEQRRGGEER